MHVISNRLNCFSESAILAMSRMSRKLRAKGLDVINLSVGEPDFKTPQWIKEAAIKAINENYTHYTPVSGYQELRETICEKFKRDNRLTFTPEQIVVSTGAKQSLANAILSLVNPGDEVIVLCPYWASYSEIIKLAEGKVIYIPTQIENDYKIDTELLETAITPKTKLLLINSPCNPSGAVYEKEELSRIAEVLNRHTNVFIISDEIYEHINFIGRHESIAQFDSIKERVIVINGLSKGFAMTGWRLGYLAAPTDIAKACSKMQGQFTSGPSSISQRAAITALKADPDEVKEIKDMIAAFKERRDLVLDRMNKIMGIRTNVPDGAFYIFANVASFFGKTDGKNIVHNSIDLCNFLLKKALVSLVPGSAFGESNCIRLSYATSNEKLIEALRRIEKAVSELKEPK